MNKYRVVLIINASYTEEVEANSDEEACDKVGLPSLCHQCARNFEVDDVVDTEVELIEEGEEESEDNED